LLLFVCFVLFYSLFDCFVGWLVVDIVVVVVIVVVVSIFCTKPPFRFAACFSYIIRSYLSLLFTNEKQKLFGK